MGVSDEDVQRWNDAAVCLRGTGTIAWLVGIIVSFGYSIQGDDLDRKLFHIYLILSLLCLGIIGGYMIYVRGETSRLLNMACNLRDSEPYGRIDGVVYTLVRVCDVVNTLYGAFVYVELSSVVSADSCVKSEVYILRKRDLQCFENSLSDIDKARYKLLGLIR